MTHFGINSCTPIAAGRMTNNKLRIRVRALKSMPQSKFTTTCRGKEAGWRGNGWELLFEKEQEKPPGTCRVPMFLRNTFQHPQGTSLQPAPNPPTLPLPPFSLFFAKKKREVQFVGSSRYSSMTFAVFSLKEAPTPEDLVLAEEIQKGHMANRGADIF